MKWNLTGLVHYRIQKRDGLEIVTSNDCDWSIWNGHVKFDWPTDTAREARIDTSSTIKICFDDLLHCLTDMCKSTEICDETLKVLLKIFFRAHLRGQVFLVVWSIYKRNSRLYSVHRMVYFSRTTYFLRKCQKSPSLQTSAQKWSIQSFKKRNLNYKKEL